MASTYGSLLRSVFTAYVDSNRDAQALQEAVRGVPWAYRKDLALDFLEIVGALKQALKSCPHPEELRTRPYPGGERCEQCKGIRTLEEHDEEGFLMSGKTWSAWRYL